MDPMPILRSALVSLMVVLAACGGGAAEERERVPWPDGLTAYVDQSRTLRPTRTVFVRLVNQPERFVTVTRAEVSSERFGEVLWTGEKRFGNEADLEFEMPRGRCGSGSDASVTLTYRIDDGPVRVSTTTARDRYGAIGIFLDRDCAEQRLAEAAELSLGEVRVVGEGRRSVLEVPVTLTPTGARDDVAFAGFEGTVLFRQAQGSAAAGSMRPVPLRGGEPVRVMLRLVPTRCDPHALAEDKIGTLVPVRVDAPDLPDGAFFHLPVGDDRRAAMRRFFGTHCGL